MLAAAQRVSSWRVALFAATFCLVLFPSVSEEGFIDEEEEEDVYSAVQTELVMVRDSRRAGTGQHHDDEDDAASLIQSQSTVISKSARHCTAGEAIQTTDDADDEVSLIQTDVSADLKMQINKCDTPESEDDTEDDEMSFFQTSVMLGKGMRRVGRGDLEDGDEDDVEHDAASFLQANIGLQQGDHTAAGEVNLNGVSVCKRKRAEEEDDDEEDDELSL